MKAFKIIDTDSDFKNTIGFVVDEDGAKACELWEKHCIENDTYDYFEDSELKEMTREEFCALEIVDETAEPDEDGEYPISPMDYDEEVANSTEAYVIEFDH